MGAPKDLTGQRFSRLIVLEPHGKDKFGNKQWLCRCDCGRLTVANSHSLTSKHKRSCGCMMRERIGNMRRIDGRSNDRLYHLYYRVRSRCENPKASYFEHYGGRGIRVCDEWQTWEAFRDWALANGYKDGLTIDRIDVNGNYEPSNCKWITQAEQMRNTRKTRYLTVNGVKKPLVTWCEELGVSFGTASARFTRGWADPLEVLFGRRKEISYGNN